MRRRLLLVAIVAIPAAIAGCGGEAATGPPDIEYGRDVCDECHMIISEPRFAAAYRDSSGEPSIFDDIGDMVDHGTRAGVLDQVTAWVHDFGTEEWVDAPDAWFVRGSDVETPMAGNIVAFAAEEDARQLAADQGGEVLRWGDLVSDPGAESSPEQIPASTNP